MKLSTILACGLTMLLATAVEARDRTRFAINFGIAIASNHGYGYGGGYYDNGGGYGGGGYYNEGYGGGYYHEYPPVCLPDAYYSPPPIRAYQPGYQVPCNPYGTPTYDSGYCEPPAGSRAEIRFRLQYRDRR